MATYLLTWNPKRWQWNHIQDSIAEIADNGSCGGRWSSGRTKRIKPDDRIFLMRVGKEPRGIVASGWAISDVFEDIHWGDNSKTTLYVDVDFDVILDPEREAIFPIEMLKSGIYERVNWTPQASGVSIPENVAEQLEKDWAKFLNNSAPVRQIEFADEIDDSSSFCEGMVKQVKVNVYERSEKARAICIKKYGLNCSVCGFNFGEKYGAIGEGFIHVHHLKPLSEIKDAYILNPIEDLRPVCPNCHAMLHQRKPTYLIEELAAIVKNRAHSM